MYTCRYNFWTEEMFPNFSISLDKLYTRSLNEYIDGAVDECDKTSEDMRNDLLYFNEFFRDFEFYYVSLIKLGIVNKKNFNNVLEALSSIKVIRIFDPKDKDVEAVTYNGEISINSKSKKKIHGMEDFAINQMIFSHELGHIICGSWEEDAWDFACKLYKFKDNKKILKNLNLNNRKYLLDGLFLLEEAVVQDCAEEVTYRLLGRKREKVKPIVDNDVLPGIRIHSNFNFYEEFQEVVVKFAKCLDFLNCKGDDSFDLVLKKLAIKVFCRDFISQLDECIGVDSDKIEDFTIMLACLGKIKEASYAKMGFGKEISTKEIESCLGIFNLIVDSNICVNLERNKQKVNA